MTDEIFDVVNAADKIVGKATRKDTHKKGLLHRSVFFFIMDKKGRIFVNQRSKLKEFYSSYWSIVFGGHVNSGESYESAVIREAEEEAGIKANPIFLSDYKKRFNKKDPENVKVYAFEIKHMPILDSKEVIGGKFMTIEELEKKLKKEKFLPETKDILELLKNNLGKMQF
jgi:isopentenyl-diphosphate delta-isomerase